MCMFIVSHATVWFCMFLVGYPQTPEPVIPLVEWHKLTYLVWPYRKTPINQLWHENVFVSWITSWSSVWHENVVVLWTTTWSSLWHENVVVWWTTSWSYQVMFVVWISDCITASSHSGCLCAVFVFSCLSFRFYCVFVLWTFCTWFWYNLT